MKFKMIDPGNSHQINSLYAWLSVDEKGDEGIIAVNVGNQTFPAVVSKLSLAMELEKTMLKIKKSTDNKVVLKKYTHAQIIRRL